MGGGGRGGRKGKGRSGTALIGRRGLQEGEESGGTGTGEDERTEHRKDRGWRGAMGGGGWMADDGAARVRAPRWLAGWRVRARALGCRGWEGGGCVGASCTARLGSRRSRAGGGQRRRRFESEIPARRPRSGSRLRHGRVGGGSRRVFAGRPAHGGRQPQPRWECSPAQAAGWVWSSNRGGEMRK